MADIKNIKNLKIDGVTYNIIDDEAARLSTVNELTAQVNKIDSKVALKSEIPHTCKGRWYINDEIGDLEVVAPNVVLQNGTILNVVWPSAMNVIPCALRILSDDAGTIATPSYLVKLSTGEVVKKTRYSEGQVVSMVFVADPTEIDGTTESSNLGGSFYVLADDGLRDQVDLLSGYSNALDSVDLAASSKTFTPSVHGYASVTNGPTDKAVRLTVKGPQLSIYTDETTNKTYWRFWTSRELMDSDGNLYTQSIIKDISDEELQANSELLEGLTSFEDLATLNLGTTTQGPWHKLVTESYVDTKVLNLVNTNKEAIEILNGTDTEEGSVAKTVKDAIAAISTSDISGQIAAHNESTEAHADIRATKVDKVEGKGLSTEDFTTAEKEKLAGLDTLLAVKADKSALAEVASNVDGLQSALDGKANSSHGNHVPTVETADNAKFLRNDNTWATVTPANIGAATIAEVDALTTDVESCVELVNDFNSDISDLYNTKISADVANDTYVKYSAAQSLNDDQKAQARSNIGAGTSSFTGYTTSNKLSTDCIDNKAGWTTNTGTVTGVKVGTTSYSPVSGVVSLPAYPVSLPASDVSTWAKAASKPTYTASEVGAVSTVASQGLTDTEKSNARANIGAGTSSLTLAGNGSATTAAKSDHTHSYLEKTTFEKSAELACGENGLVCLGKFGAYDTNITIELNSTTSQTYHATIVIWSQNVEANGTSGSVGCYVYDDADNHITPLISVFRPYGSANRQIEVYANLPGWSKNLVHVQGVAIVGGMTDILTSVSSIPTSITGKTKVTPINVLTTNFAASSHTHAEIPTLSYDSSTKTLTIS